MNKTEMQKKQPVNSNRRSFFASLLIGAIGFSGLMKGVIQAGPPGRGGKGRGKGYRGQRGIGASDPSVMADQSLIRTLLNGRSQIRRQIKILPNGVETLTETDNPQLRSVLVQHVRSMKQRVEQGRPIHLRDPLFAALFRNAKKITMMELTATPKGIHVLETSDDPYTVKLIQAHAQVVSLFVKNGQLEVRKNHPVPNSGLPS